MSQVNMQATISAINKCTIVFINETNSSNSDDKEQYWKSIFQQNFIEEIIKNPETPIDFETYRQSLKKIIKDCEKEQFGLYCSALDKILDYDKSVRTSYYADELRTTIIRGCTRKELVRIIKDSWNCAPMTIKPVEYRKWASQQLDFIDGKIDVIPSLPLQEF
jgi:hypothetical protein